MASNSIETKKKRANKLKKAGRTRKNKLNNKGTTKSKKELFKIIK